MTPTEHPKARDVSEQDEGSLRVDESMGAGLIGVDQDGDGREVVVAGWWERVEGYRGLEFEISDEG